MQGLSSVGEVIYLGTFAKSMLPGIRLAYMVVPPALVAALTQGIRNTGIMASTPVQAAMADFIATGQYRAHLRRIRSAYEERGLALHARLQQALGERVDVVRPTGGVQLLLRFRDKQDHKQNLRHNLQQNDVTIARALQAAGIGAAALSQTFLGPPLQGLIIGFSSADQHTIDRGVPIIAKVINAHSR